MTGDSKLQGCKSSRRDLVGRWFIPYIFLMALSPSGCTFFTELIGMGAQRPRVEVKSIEVRGMSLSDVELGVGLIVENPNNFTVSLKSVRYTLEANGKGVASGEFLDGLTILAKGKGEATLPVKVNLKEAGEIAQQLLGGKDKVKAVVAGLAVFDTPVGGIEMPFSQEQSLFEP